MDQYPVGRRRLEPIGVLVFSIIMITSFFQVALECLTRLNSGEHSIIQLTLPAIIIMSSTVVIKLFCWLYCRLIKNSSVQALAQDAMTDIVFNIFSIIFPLGTRICVIRYLTSLIVKQLVSTPSSGGWMPSEVWSCHSMSFSTGQEPPLATFETSREQRQRLTSETSFFTLRCASRRLSNRSKVFKHTTPETNSTSRLTLFLTRT